MGYKEPKEEKPVIKNEIEEISGTELDLDLPENLGSLEEQPDEEAPKEEAKELTVQDVLGSFDLRLNRVEAGLYRLSGL